jgi:hypothetical protein
VVYFIMYALFDSRFDASRENIDRLETSIRQLSNLVAQVDHSIIQGCILLKIVSISGGN